MVQDFLISYIFVRICDDKIDSGITKQQKWEFLELFEKFLNEVYEGQCSQKEFVYAFKSNTFHSSGCKNIDWDYYREKLTRTELLVFRNFSRIAFYMPKKLFDDIISGFKEDIEEKCYNSEDEFLQYAKLVSSSSMALLIFIIWRKAGNLPHNYDTVASEIIKNGHILGQVRIKLIKIA